MPSTRAVLVFVDGPQKGQRVVLPGGAVLAGRSPAAGLRFKEEYVSREQMRFALTPDGWIVENLSAGSRIRINGKKYKKGKQVLLDTGDVVGAGAKTEMLFVAPEDDVDEALQAHLVKAAAAEESLQAIPAEVIGEVEPGQALPQAAYQALPAGQAGAAIETKLPPEAEEKGDEDTAEQQRKAKLKKYGILFAVYAVVFIALIMLLNRMRATDDVTGPGVPGILTRDRISDVVNAKYDKTPNKAAADEALKEALRWYRAKAFNEGNLYRSVKQFKLAIAYSVTKALQNPGDLRIFDDAKKQLVDKVVENYENAVTYERAKNWRSAKKLFERILRIVPAKSAPSPEVKNEIFDNVVAHITYVQGKLVKKKR